jgi:lipoprotein-releasing system ATP-binding protein
VTSSSSPGRASGPIIEISELSKDYRGLRPLRIQRFNLGAGDRSALLGVDQPMAETFVNLVTGAVLPERGEVKVLGRSTASIDNAADWLALADRFGIVSERAVLLDAFSAMQNLVMPFTLEIDPPPAGIRDRAGSLADEVGLARANWERPVGDLDAASRLRIRLARALALDPPILLLDHASAGLPAASAIAFGQHVREVAQRRGCALVALTADRTFAEAVAARVLTLDPATGRLAERRRFFARLLGGT